MSLKRKIIIGTVGVLVGSTVFADSESAVSADNTKDSVSQTVVSENLEEVILQCDGVSITEDCEFEGILYSVYKYHDEVPEKFHYEQKIAGYNQVVVGYCTMCNDGTRSPSCSVGSGTCSHHGGVKEYDAPIYEEEPYYENVKVIDIKYQAAWHEIVLK